jgi:glucose dehydrogenase
MRKRSMRRVDSLSLLFAFLALATGNGTRARSIGAAADWISHGADADETNFSQLDQINAANVNRLGLGWWRRAGC